jgi:hypothetical protein
MATTTRVNRRYDHRADVKLRDLDQGNGLSELFAEMPVRAGR